jgi:ABC-type Mn2+/Zn2+ transport system permease subunit
VRSTILVAMVIGVGSVFAGLTVSYYADLAPGGAIVLVAAGCFGLAQAAQTLTLRARGGRTPGSGHA